MKQRIDVALANHSKKADELLLSYKDKWKNVFHNESSTQLEKMWKDIFMSMQNIERSNGLKNIGSVSAPMPSTIVFCSTMGTGKTTTVQHYLENMDTVHYHALIVVELIETCNEYENILKEKGAIAVHSDNNNSILNCLNAPILIITHNMLLSKIFDGTADDIFERFSLIVIDEQINTFRHIEFSYHHLKTRLLTILEYYELENTASFRQAKLIVSKMEEIRKNNGSSNLPPIIWDNYAVKQDGIELNLLEVANELANRVNDIKFIKDDDLKILTTHIKQLRIISKNGRIKIPWLEQKNAQISFNIVIDFFPSHVSKIIFDGTASVNETYKFIQKHSNESPLEIKTYHNLRSFKNAKIRYFQIPSGKSSLTSNNHRFNKHKKSDVQATLKDGVEKALKWWGKNEKVLFIVHKDNAEYIMKIVPKTYSVTWWGKHIGSNDWKDFKKIVVLGLNYLPGNVYNAIYFSTFTPKVTMKLSAIDNLVVSLLSVDILQGIFRGSLRQVEDEFGNCPKGTEIVIGLPKKSTERNLILDRLKIILHDIDITELNDGINKVDTQSVNSNKMNKLITILNYNREAVFITAKEIEALMGAPLRDMLIRGVNVKKNIYQLECSDWYFEKTKENGYFFEYKAFSVA